MSVSIVSCKCNVRLMVCETCVKQINAKSFETFQSYMYCCTARLANNANISCVSTNQWTLTSLWTFDTVVATKTGPQEKSVFPSLMVNGLKVKVSIQVKLVQY